VIELTKFMGYFPWQGCLYRWYIFSNNTLVQIEPYNIPLEGILSRFLSFYDFCPLCFTYFSYLCSMKFIGAPHKSHTGMFNLLYIFNLLHINCLGCPKLHPHLQDHIPDRSGLDSPVTLSPSLMLIILRQQAATRPKV